MSDSINKAEENYLAHSCNIRNIGHLLKDHLKGVASRMEAVLPDHDHRRLFKVTGLLHDFGKYLVVNK